MGAAAFNQLVERTFDARMRRTCRRPLPMRQVTPTQAFIFASLLLLTGVLSLIASATTASALLATLAALLYLLAYTPLKRSSGSAVLVGAVPGALPPLMGYAALTGHVGLSALTLFALMFLWQMPHFLAIGWMYRHDYARAGFPLLAVNDPTGRVTALCLLCSSTLLALVSLVPAARGVAGPAYLAISLLGALSLIALAVAFAGSPTPRRARAIFIASLVYLPLVLTALLADAA